MTCQCFIVYQLEKTPRAVSVSFLYIYCYSCGLHYSVCLVYNELYRYCSWCERAFTHPDSREHLSLFKENKNSSYHLSHLYCAKPLKTWGLASYHTYKLNDVFIIKHHKTSINTSWSLSETLCFQSHDRCLWGTPPAVKQYTNTYTHI